MKFRLIAMILLSLFILLPQAALSSSTDFSPEDIPSASETDISEGGGPQIGPEMTELTGYSELPFVDIRATSAILVDAKTGEFLYHKDINTRREPASLTKVMTCLLALEYGNLEDIVTASSEAVTGLNPDGSTARILPGEEMTLKDLLYCVMLKSANEGCNVLAEYVAGNVEDFVALMNKRAIELGCTNTNFANTHGLHDDNHYSSAYDMYLITRAAMEIPAFLEICHTDTYSVPPTNKTPDGRRLVTTNALISNKQYSDYLYPYAKGVKTGHTPQAGYCLISTAERDNLTLISVVMGCTLDAETNLIRSFVETKLLFEWAFDNFVVKKLLSKADVPLEVKVIEGVDKDSVQLSPVEDISALVPKALDISTISRTIVNNYPQGIYAPVEKGMVMGSITLVNGEKTYGTVDLAAIVQIEKNQLENIINDAKTEASKPWVKWVIIGGVSLLIIYVVFTILVNVNRRKNTRGNYKGSHHKKKYR